MAIENSNLYLSISKLRIKKCSYVYVFHASSGTQFFSANDHYLPSSRSLDAYGASITRPSFCTLLVPSASLLVVSCRVSLAFQLPQDVSVSLFSSHGQKWLPGVYGPYLWVMLLCQPLLTLFRLISL